jgi:hypothetical protein
MANTIKKIMDEYDHGYEDIPRGHKRWNKIYDWGNNRRKSRKIKMKNGHLDHTPRTW